MKEYFKSEYKPILIGILAYSILYAANELYGFLLIQTDIIKIDSINESSNWHPLLIFSDIISTLLLVVPGFLAGLFSNKKGIINGIIVIFVCIIVQFFALSINYMNFALNFYLIFILLQQLILPVTVGAVSAAAGQYHMNKRKCL